MRVLLWSLLLICTAAALSAHAGEEVKPHWWKGNLHAHSFWSDGDNFPEMVVQWHHEHGYHFLTLSNHNVLSQGRRWIVATDPEGKEIQTTRPYSRDIDAVVRT